MNNLLKRVLDIFISIISLLLFSPLFIIISLLIKIDSKGPIFFKQIRLTKNGKEFKILKFRSMVVNAEVQGSGLFIFEKDNRITKIGKFLRKTSLDELPQLINVLIGDMSIVGPRPSVINEIGSYSELNIKYKKRFSVKSGLTGLAQVSGRNELPWDKKIIYDNKYVDLFKKYGILIDIKIIFMTFISVFKAKDIFEVKRPEYEGLSDEEISKYETERIILDSTRKDGD